MKSAISPDPRSINSVWKLRIRFLSGAINAADVIICVRDSVTLTSKSIEARAAYKWKTALNIVLANVPLFADDAIVFKAILTHRGEGRIKELDGLKSEIYRNFVSTGYRTGVLRHTHRWVMHLANRIRAGNRRRYYFRGAIGRRVIQVTVKADFPCISGTSGTLCESCFLAGDEKGNSNNEQCFYRVFHEKINLMLRNNRVSHLSKKMGSSEFSSE